MDDELDLLDNGTDTTYKGKRPAFLQVLCILTFVGAGLGVVYSFFQLFAISAMETAMEAFGSITDADVNDMLEADNPLADTYRWMKLAVYAGIFGNLACLAGAIVMWGMRKVGYLVYVVGQAVPLVVGVLSMINMVGGVSGGFGAFGLIGIVIFTIFPVGFIIMYGLNYKYLR